MLLLNSVHPGKPPDGEFQINGFASGPGNLNGNMDFTAQDFQILGKFCYLILR